MAAALTLVRVWINRWVGAAYFHRDPVAIIAVQGNAAGLLVHPTTSIRFLLHRLSTLRVGGATPLDHGLVLARRLVMQWRDRYPTIDLQVLSDGRSTSSLSTPKVERAIEALRRHTRRITVINPQPAARAYAQALAGRLGAGYAETDRSSGYFEA
jgi:magnesium chelatase subunit D